MEVCLGLSVFTIFFAFLLMQQCATAVTHIGWLRATPSNYRGGYIKICSAIFDDYTKYRCARPSTGPLISRLLCPRPSGSWFIVSLMNPGFSDTTGCWKRTMECEHWVKWPVNVCILAFFFCFFIFFAISRLLFPKNKHCTWTFFYCLSNNSK